MAQSFGGVDHFRGADGYARRPQLGDEAGEPVQQTTGQLCLGAHRGEATSSLAARSMSERCFNSTFSVSRAVAASR